MIYLKIIKNISINKKYIKVIYEYVLFNFKSNYKIILYKLHR